MRSQLVRHDDSRCEALLLEKLAHQLQGRRFVTSALHEDVENLALAVHGAPEIHPLAGKPHHHLVQMPMGCWFWPTLPEAAADGRPELQHPPADALVGHVESSLRQQVLDVPVAQREPDVQPHRVLDDDGRELVTRIRDRRHRYRLRGLTSPDHPSRDNARVSTQVAPAQRYSADGPNY